MNNVLITYFSVRCLRARTASVLPAVFVVAASYAECDHALAVIFFIISVGTHAFSICGMNTNPMDLSPNYAGVLTSLGNGTGSLMGILAPYTVGLLVPNVCSLWILTVFCCWSFELSCTIPYFIGISVRVASSLLDYIRRSYGKGSDLRHMGLGQCAAMECR